VEKATYQDSALSKKSKALINCESCMEWHIREAANAGANQQ